MASKKKRWSGGVPSGNVGRQKGALFVAGSGAGLSESAQDTSITLKNGGRIPVGEAVSSYEILKGMLDRFPEHFKAVRALASGRVPDVPERILDELRSTGFLTATGELKPSARDVFESSYRPTPDGDVMASPFAPATEHEERLLADREALREHRWKTLVRKLTRDKPGQSH